VRSPGVSDQLHSFHQPIASNGLFWTTAIPSDSLSIRRHGRSASLEICDYPVIDQPKFPAPGPTYEARMSIRLEWKGTGDLVGWTNPLQKYRIQFYRATAQVAFDAKVPALGFLFSSGNLSSSHSIFAMIGYVETAIFK